ncbi:MAG TPA: NADH-quinone oxidoreductase subunit M [Chthoniobacterales bacterium]|nr:NADH-quinone oxidoreductase subunit M [Chthoniobacterales bacterium]
MILLFVVLFPIAAALAILLGAPARRTALWSAGITLGGTLFLCLAFEGGRGGYEMVTSFPVSSDWNINFTLGIDGLSLIMLLLTAVVLFAAIWFTGEIAQHRNAFYACLLFIGAGAIGAFASLDLFFFYAFHELALIPTFLLIGIWGTGDRQLAAWKITIYLATGSFVLLLGLIMLYHAIPETARSFDFRVLPQSAILIPAKAQGNIFLVLLLGFGILVSLFPFHTWAPQAYASAPAPAAMLHAGVLKKFGLYGLLRLALPLLPAGAQQYNTLLIYLLLGNIIYVGLVTIAQKRLDWMLGYSSVMHMGYIFLGIASGTLVGTSGAAVLIFAHGISIALLFAIAGEVRQRAGTLVLEELGGLGKLMPRAGFAFGLAAFASIGLPGFANFAGEVMVLFGTFRNGANPEHFTIYQWATVLGLWGVVISAVYMLRAYRAVFMGSMGESVTAVTDLRRGLRIPIGLLVAITLWVGFFPEGFVRLVTPTFKTYFAAKQ